MNKICKWFWGTFICERNSYLWIPINQFKSSSFWFQHTFWLSIYSEQKTFFGLEIKWLNCKESNDEGKKFQWIKRIESNNVSFWIVLRDWTKQIVMIHQKIIKLKSRRRAKKMKGMKIKCGCSVKTKWSLKW